MQKSNTFHHMLRKKLHCICTVLYSWCIQHSQTVYFSSTGHKRSVTCGSIHRFFFLFTAFDECVSLIIVYLKHLARRKRENKEKTKETREGFKPQPRS